MRLFIVITVQVRRWESDFGLYRLYNL